MVVGYEEGNQSEKWKISKKWETVRQDQLPEWLKNNKFILANYRPQLKSYKLCLASIIRLHTETGNIWSHLIALVAFAYLFFAYLFRLVASVTVNDVFILVYIILGSSCWLLSVLFHTFRCHSQKTLRRTECFDYCGILGFTLSAFIPVAFNSFHCDDFLQKVYVGALVSCGLIIFVLINWEPFSRIEYRIHRMATFMTLSFFVIASLIHAAFKYGLVKVLGEEGVRFHFGFYFIALTALVIYSIQFPERLMPGKFDIYFHSHQIFHILAMTGGFMQLHALYQIKLFTEKIICTE